MPVMPKTLNQWLMFTLAVAGATFVISSIARRVPQVGQILSGV